VCTAACILLFDIMYAYLMQLFLFHFMYIFELHDFTYLEITIAFVKWSAIQNVGL
jgi:hypothetical protein